MRLPALAVLGILAQTRFDLGNDAGQRGLLDGRIRAGGEGARGHSWRPVGEIEAERHQGNDDGGGERNGRVPGLQQRAGRRGEGLDAFGARSAGEEPARDLEFGRLRLCGAQDATGAIRCDLTELVAIDGDRTCLG